MVGNNSYVSGKKKGYIILSPDAQSFIKSIVEIILEEGFEISEAFHINNFSDLTLMREKSANIVNINNYRNLKNNLKFDDIGFLFLIKKETNNISYDISKLNNEILFSTLKKWGKGGLKESTIQLSFCVFEIAELTPLKLEGFKYFNNKLDAINLQKLIDYGKNGKSK